MDVAIHELGRELLEDKLDKQREAAVLKPVRSPTDKKPPGGRRRERYEPSAGELAAALSSQMGIGSEPLLGPGTHPLPLCCTLPLRSLAEASKLSVMVPLRRCSGRTVERSCGGKLLATWFVNVSTWSLSCSGLWHAMHDIC